MANRLSTIESKHPNSDICEAAQQTLQRLNDLQAEFKVLHFELIDLVDEEKALKKEQEIFDTVDEQVDDTKIRIKKIVALQQKPPNMRYSLSQKKNSLQ